MPCAPRSKDEQRRLWIAPHELERRRRVAHRSVVRSFERRCRGDGSKWLTSTAPTRQRDGDEPEDHRLRPDGQHGAGEGRGGERAHALDPTRRDVGRGKLLGRPGESRSERRLRGPRHRESDRRTDEQRVDDQRGRAREERDGHYGARECLREIAGDQGVSGSMTLANGGHDGRERRRWNENDRRDDAAFGHAPLRVGVDEHREPRRPLAAVERREGELDAPSSRLRATTDRTKTRDERSPVRSSCVMPSTPAIRRSFQARRTGSNGQPAKSAPLHP